MLIELNVTKCSNLCVNNEMILVGMNIGFKYIQPKFKMKMRGKTVNNLEAIIVNYS